MKKFARQLTTLVAAVAISGFASVSFAEEVANKVATVNIQQVLQQSQRVASLSKKLEEQFKPRQQKLNDQQKSLQDEIEKFRKTGKTMSQKDQESAQKKINDDRADFLKQAMAYQQDVNKEQAKIMQGIQGDINTIVGDIAKKSSYNMVLDAQAVIFAANSVDITKDVEKAFNDKK